MAEPGKTLGSMRFGPFDLSIETGELRKNGVRLKLTGQPIQVLIRLVAKRGSLVTREELERELWGSNIFGDPTHGLNAAVNRLREALGDSATEPTYIETVPGRGYRFTAMVDAPLSAQGRSENVVPTAGSRPDSSRWKAEGSKPRWWKRKATIAIAACGFVTGCLYPWIGLRVDEFGRLYQLRQMKVVPITALPGSVGSPTFSPDGSQLAFVWNGGNGGTGGDLYVKVIGSDKLLRLTHDGGGQRRPGRPTAKA